VRPEESLYEGLEYDAGLSWSEHELQQRLRTKHVHGLHPYLGKYVPQLVEELLRRYVPRDGRVLDPFAGSGTTLVQSLETGHDSDFEGDGKVVIVVNDSRALYADILDRSGLVLEARHRRHVNRRTGRCAGEYFEEILVARKR
jgi:hypothetical protein